MLHLFMLLLINYTIYETTRTQLLLLLIELFVMCYSWKLWQVKVCCPVVVSVVSLMDPLLVHTCSIYVFLSTKQVNYESTTNNKRNAVAGWECVVQNSSNINIGIYHCWWINSCCMLILSIMSTNQLYELAPAKYWWLKICCVF